MSGELIGRVSEKKQFTKLLNSDEAELVGLYGRRRVGKTYLVKAIIEKSRALSFCVTGLKNAFLKSRGIHLNQKQVLDLYMVMGGIPYYLKAVEKGKCEIKYSDKPYRITKAYANTLGDKLDCFQQVVNPKKQLFLTMITTQGLLPNQYVDVLLDDDITLEALF